LLSVENEPRGCLLNSDGDKTVEVDFAAKNWSKLVMSKGIKRMTVLEIQIEE